MAAFSAVIKISVISATSGTYFHTNPGSAWNVPLIALNAIKISCVCNARLIRLKIQMVTVLDALLDV